MRVSGLVLSFAMVMAPSGAALARAADADLDAGVASVEEGDFEAGISKLDGVVKRLASQPGAQPKELARAYLYLAIGYLGLSQEVSAKARFIDAIASDPQMALSPREFPPRIIQSFEEARRAAARATTPSRPALVTKQVPFFKAVKAGEFAAVRDLLREEPGLASEKDAAFGATGLHWAALKGHEAIVGLLLAAGSDPSAANAAGETPYQVAVRAEHESIAELVRVPEDAVFDAVKAGDLSRVKQLVEGDKALLTRKDQKFGATVLHFAALRGNVKLAEYLVQAGADVKATNGQGETALQVARRAHRDEVVALLGGPGGSSAAPSPSSDKPAKEDSILDAAKTGDLDRVRKLVREDPSAVNRRDAAFGATPLHWAALRGHANVVAYLISAGADKAAENNKGETPIQVARRAGRDEVVQILLR